jgi:hypothetical protein
MITLREGGIYQDRRGRQWSVIAIVGTDRGDLAITSAGGMVAIHQSNGRTLSGRPSVFDLVCEGSLR